jgi:hypothetical protein
MMRYASNYRFTDSQTYEDAVNSNFHFDAYADAAYAWRYPNLTSHVEYMGKVIKQTIEEEMHNEALYIRNIHRARLALKQIMEGPDPLLDTIISSVWQNKQLSKALRKRFPILDNEERAARIVNAITNAFRYNPSKAALNGEDEDNESVGLNK